MVMRSNKLRDFSLEDGKDMVMDLLSGDDDVAVVLEKRGGKLRLATMQAYDHEAMSIIDEAREMSERLKAEGYSRDEIFDDMEAVREELRNLRVD